MEDIRKCKKRGRRGLSWTSAKKALSKTVAPRGGGRCDGLRLRGVWRNSGGRFSARGGRWRLEKRGTFVAAELAASMTLKS